MLTHDRECDSHIGMPCDCLPEADAENDAREAIAEAVRKAVRAEREACAKLADLQAALDKRQADIHKDIDNSFNDCAITAESIARHIRNRTNLEK